MVSVVKRVIDKRRDGGGLEELPFIDSLLQNYDSEDKVWLYQHALCYIAWYLGIGGKGKECPVHMACTYV